VNVDAAAARDFERAYAEHASACRAFAFALPGDPDDATHEAFVRLARRLAAGEGLPESVRGWLLAAVRTAALDDRRSRLRRQRREAFSIPARREGDATDPAVRVALWRIDERRRQAIVLRLWCGCDFAQAAQLLGCATSTAHDLYRRGLDDLRRELADFNPEGGR